MKELTNEQYRQIGVAIKEARLTAPTFYAELEDSGRAAYAFCFPYAVTEALEEPQPAERATAGADYLAFSGGFPKDYREILQFTLKNFIDNRYTRLTAKPDSLREALHQIEFKNDVAITCKGSGPVRLSECAIEKIVAAVDEARKGAK